jgi:hypothetical protein
LVALLALGLFFFRLGLGRLRLQLSDAVRALIGGGRPDAA